MNKETRKKKQKKHTINKIRKHNRIKTTERKEYTNTARKYIISKDNSNTTKNINHKKT